MIPALDGRRVHLLGICGAGMASLAGMLKQRGFTVSGSDQNVYPPMSEVLPGLGIEVSSPYRPDNLPADLDLVVVGNALSRGNPELEEMLDRNLPYASMAEVIKEVFIRGNRSVVVAGTHGKTTTTSMIAWTLTNAGRDPSFLVGGIAENFGTSYRLGKGGIFVIEGDEYDTAYFDKGPKFLHYLPEVVVLGNVEYDHADIFPDLDAVATAFKRLVNLIPRRGLLVVGAESPLAVEIAERAPCRVESFSVSAEASWQARMVASGEQGSRFEVLREGKLFAVLEGPLWGDAALRNMLSVIAVGSWFGLDRQELAEWLVSYRGVCRRLDVRGNVRGVTLVDDFAHHPTAVRETLRAARLRWPGRKLWAVFEPRSFTARSKVFQRQLPEAFESADRVVISNVFPSARLDAGQELSEEELVDDLRHGGVEAWFIPTVEAIVEFLASHLAEGDVVLVMSNGGFGGIHQKLLDALEG